MADSVVTCFLNDLERLLNQEVTTFHHGVKEQLHNLQDDVKKINGFLQDSEAERNENDVVKEVVDEIKDVVLEAEDVVDAYLANLVNHKRSLLGKLPRTFGHIKVLYNVIKNIKSTQKTIKEIYDNKMKYGIIQDIQAKSSTADIADQAEGSMMLRRTRTNSTEEEEEHDDPQHKDDQHHDHVVGFIPETTTLVKHLVEGDSLDVISIVGMAGLGKTTLARKIFDDIRVKNHFQYRCAWVYVSQDYQRRRLLLDILNCFMTISAADHQISEKSSDEELVEELFNYLKDNKFRYFIVMDNVWKTEIWEDVRKAFPDESNGSKILITSRESEVASYVSPALSYSLSFLDKSTSWKLFHKKAFRGGTCPSELRTVGRQLAESCNGLPMSIVVLGGILAHTKKSRRTWSKLLGNVDYYCDEETRCIDILSLSYNHLPRHLKSCFMHLGVFPTDYEIPARLLIKLWLSEGFIPKIEKRKLEDVAEEYLVELINCSLIQVTSRKTTDGGVKTCRIQDLVLDLSIFQSAREKFLDVHSQANYPLSPCNARRLSVQGNVSEFISSYPSDHSSTARSLLVFGEGKSSSFDTKQWKWVYQRFKFIRVLCLEKVNLNSIPNKIDKLIFLRYLRIWSEKVLEIQAFPASICNLQFLETIDVKGQIEDPLPKGIWMMKNLIHLNISGGMSFPPSSSTSSSTPTDTSSTSNLQVLSYLLVDEKTVDLINIIPSKFPNLRKLHLKYDAASSIEQGHELDMEKMLGSLKDLQNLESLKFLGFPKSKPSLNIFPSSTLFKLTLKSSYLDSTYFRILGKLPNLQSLKLKGNKFSTSSLSCDADDYRGLHVFQMIDLEIETWELKSNAMLELQRLVINGCSKLTDLPKDQLSSLKSLQSVQILPMSESSRKVLQELKKNGCKGLNQV